MFILHFGNYLVETNKLSKSQYENLIKIRKNTHVKLGLIAIEKGLLTGEQAEEINQLQMQMDKRFGDIAIEKGFLTEHDIFHLLKLQSNPYLQFVQNLISENLMTLGEISTTLESFKVKYNFSDTDIQNLKSGELNKVFSVFVNIDDSLLNELASLTTRNITRFIDSDVVINRSYHVKEYEFHKIAYQNLVGDSNFFIAFAGQDENLLAIAETFADEKFDSVNEDALDSVSEFINCSSGLFASKLSLENIDIEITPPLYGTSSTIKGDVYVIPYIILGKEVDLIIANKNQLEVH